MVLYNLNQVTVKGTISYVSHKDTYSNFLARVYTGEKRKETDEYAPSVTVGFILNEKEVKSLNLEKGDTVIISGKLSARGNKESDIISLTYVDVSLPFVVRGDEERKSKNTSEETISTEETDDNLPF